MSKAKIDEVKDAVSTVKGKSFNSIMNEYQNLLWLIDNGEFTEELQEQLAANQDDAESKLLGMYYVIQMNTSKIDNFYKLELESIQARVKRLNRANGILKENCMLIAEHYGTNNKYTSLQLNCSKVTKEVLNIEEYEYETRVLEIKDIISGLHEDDSTVDEFNCFSTDFNIKSLDISDAIKLKKLLDDNFPNKDITFNVSMDKKMALELVKAKEEPAEGQPIPPMFDSTPIEPIGIKGVSKGYIYYPRFS